MTSLTNSLSVVIPVFNGERFISRAIESALTQSSPAMEIVVVNDGSTDQTLQKLDEFGSRIRVVSTSNGGVSRARSRGMEESRGSYVAFLDADDVWFPQKLEVQMSFMNRHPQVGFCCSDFILQTPQQEYSHFHSLHMSHLDQPYVIEEEPFRSLIKMNFVGTSTVIIKRDVFEKAGLFNSSYKVSEDYDYWLRCAMLTKFMRISQPLSQKEQHETNLSNNKRKIYRTGQRVVKNVFRKERAYIDQHDLAGVCRAKIASRYFRLGDGFFEEGRIKRAYKLYFCGAACYKGDWQTQRDFLSCVVKKSLRLLSFGFLRKSSFRKRPACAKPVGSKGVL